MKRNKFSLSHTKLLSMNMGSLIPIGLIEVLPGDTIQQSTSALIRCSPMLAPVMHRCDVRIHHWFVPHRLSWGYYLKWLGTSFVENPWEEFITGGPDNDDSSSPPTLNLATEYAVGRLYDYFGCSSPGSNNPFPVSALPVSAYNMIYNEFYRDQDLVTEAPAWNPEVLPCMWEKDYFTSARPWEIKGPSITIPIGFSAPVIADGVDPIRVTNPSLGITNEEVGVGVTGANPTLNLVSGNASSTGALQIGSPSGLIADLTNASAVTINVLREALALQRYGEARARFGSRYSEYLLYLGVQSQDARLQRPEYLGGGRNSIQFSEVLQTGVTTSGNAAGVGTMRGHGIAGMRSNRYRKFFSEHGYIISLMSVRPKTIYMQGTPRTFLRTTKEDFWQKELETIGQQEITDKEVYAASATPNAQWGFQDRYDEYRRMESSVAGEFRGSTLNFWHLARSFASTPDLNDEFVECVPTERVFASTETDVLYVMANHSVQARRMLQKTGRSMTF